MGRKLGDMLNEEFASMHYLGGTRELCHLIAEPRDSSCRNFLAFSNIGFFMENVTLHLSQPMMAEMARVSREEGLSEVALAERAIKYYIFESRFADLHARMVRHASERGIRTDEDVFRRFS